MCKINVYNSHKHNSGPFALHRMILEWCTAYGHMIIQLPALTPSFIIPPLLFMLPALPTALCKGWQPCLLLLFNASTTSLFLTTSTPTILLLW